MAPRKTCVTAQEVTPIDNPAYTARQIDDLSLPFCACGRSYSRCDGSRMGCPKPHEQVILLQADVKTWLTHLDVVHEKRGTLHDTPQYLDRWIHYYSE